jgi:hypothetical protein
LPAAGWRNNTNGALNNAGTNGNYWSSTPSGTTNAMNLNFNSGNTNVNNNNRANGFSVRCVAELNANVLRVNEWTSNCETKKALFARRRGSQYQWYAQQCRHGRLLLE